MSARVSGDWTRGPCQGLMGGVPSLTRLAKGGLVGFPAVMRMARWLECPVARFTVVSAL